LIQRHLEEERRNLALELHDELGQAVTAVKTIAATVVNRSKNKYPEIESAAQMIVDVSGQMYDSMHGMVRRLRPMALEKLGLRDAIQELVEAQRERNPEIRFDLTVLGDLSGLDADTNIAVYRVVQECLTNIVRHAQASEAVVKLELDQQGYLRLRIADNGKGIGVSEETREEHFGLLGMRERIESLGGTFLLENGEGSGVAVSAVIPLNQLVESA
jgi:two-component system, NarL family, sensor histidine kinase UhpB